MVQALPQKKSGGLFNKNKDSQAKPNLALDSVKSGQSEGTTEATPNNAKPRSFGFK